MTFFDSGRTISDNKTKSKTDSTIIK